MRVIFLNSWFGKVGKPFFDFIKDKSSKTDIFCFMEFTPELFAKVSKILSDFHGFIEKGMVLESWGVTDCQVIFTKKNLEILLSGKLHIYKETPDDTGFASFINFKKDGKLVNIMNVHGKALPGDKMDTLVRLKQSEIIIEFFKNRDGAKIVGGDFNLNPDTKSVTMFEEAGYRNLIRNFGIKNTRNNISWKNFENEPGFSKQYFADYVFVSPNVKIIKFEVPYMEISDHLPQILEFEV